jgi:hypothetical protein
MMINKGGRSMYQIIKFVSEYKGSSFDLAVVCTYSFVALVGIGSTINIANTDGTTLNKFKTFIDNSVKSSIIK